MREVKVKAGDTTSMRRKVIMGKADNVFHWLACPVIFVSTAHGQLRDIMTATAMFISEEEPLLVVSVAKNHLTENIINQSGKFTVVIVGENQRRLAMQVGGSKGDGIDKVTKFSIKTLSEKPEYGPIPEGAAAWLACEVEGSQDIRGYRVFTGRVVDQREMAPPPLIWRKNAFFTLNPKTD
jgi:flavin reductase (DIM6/NTAB) family NADH-FMN oxidoreductase RutF